MDFLKDSWRQRRADLQKELDLIEGKPGLTIGDASEHSKTQRARPDNGQLQSVCVLPSLTV